MVTHQSGISNKHPKVHNNPNLSSGVSGIYIEHTFSLPVYKMHSIQKEASHFLSLERVSIKALASLIGMLVATKPTVWIDPLHYLALRDVNIQSFRWHPSYQSSVNLSEEEQADLRWWQSDPPYHCSAPMLRPQASIVIELNAFK